MLREGDHRQRHGRILGAVPQRSVFSRNAAMTVYVRTMLDDARWWAIRRAQNRKPATYRCPLCGRHLHAMTDHVLIAPEGDIQRRRHAHSECVRAAREAGGLPSYDEWRNTHPPTRWRSRLFGKRGKRPF